MYVCFAKNHQDRNTDFFAQNGRAANVPPAPVEEGRRADSLAYSARIPENLSSSRHRSCADRAEPSGKL